jgi:hypothetical protein
LKMFDVRDTFWVVGFFVISGQVLQVKLGNMAIR